MLKYAFAHPGKIGDMLYILPTVKKVCERDNAVADIYTSEMCRAAENLVKYQSYVHDFIIPSDYVIRDCGQGVQPWNMPIPSSGYDKIYQLGYQYFPHGPLHQFTARMAGEYPVSDPQYNYPDKTFCEEPYVVTTMCAHRAYPELWDHYRHFINNCPLKVIQTGEKREFISDTKAEDMTGCDLLDALSLIAKAKAFIGFYSGMLVLANGIPNLLKIVTMWPGVGEQHGLHIPKTVDLCFATGETMLQTLKDNL